MSRTQPDRFERLARLSGCWACGAGPFIWCTTTNSDRPADTLHAVRTRGIKAAWWQGYDEGKAGASRCCTAHVDACDLLPCCVRCPLGQKCGANIDGTFCTLPVRDHANPFSTLLADHQIKEDTQ